MRNLKMSKAKKQIQIGQFSITGTSNLLVANKAVQKLLARERCGLKHASYTIGGKTITIKPLTK